jgi:L-fuculose-phosphate aldolase
MAISNIKEAQKLVHESALRMKTSGLIAGTWGNISCRVDENTMVITPSGLDYDKITPNEMSVVNLNDLTFTGPKPSSEKGLHAKIYLTRKNINAVIHNHSQSASTVAAARVEVPPILDDMAQIIGPTIRVAEYALPSTKKITNATVKALRGRNGVLMANHGALTVGRDMEEAFTAALVLEKSCRAFIEASFMGGAKSINRFEAAFMHQYFLKKYRKK